MPDVASVVLKYIVTHHTQRDLLQYVFRNVLSADAFLPFAETHHASVFKRKHLSVKHGSGRQIARKRRKFRKFLRHQFFPATPDVYFAVPADDLTPDAVVFS